MTTKLDEKLARIRAGKYKPTDFILAYAGFATVAAFLTFAVILMALAFRRYDHRSA